MLVWLAHIDIPKQSEAESQLWGFMTFECTVGCFGKEWAWWDKFVQYFGAFSMAQSIKGCQRCNISSQLQGCEMIHEQPKDGKQYGSLGPNKGGLSCIEKPYFRCFSLLLCVLCQRFSLSSPHDWLVVYNCTCIMFGIALM